MSDEVSPAGPQLICEPGQCERVNWLQAALLFYANPGSWRPERQIDNPPGPCPVEEDQGEIARQALKDSQ